PVSLRFPHSCPTRRSSDLFLGQVLQREFLLVGELLLRSGRLGGGLRQSALHLLLAFGLTALVLGPLALRQHVGVAAGIFYPAAIDRKSTRLNSSHVKISYA